MLDCHLINVQTGFSDCSQVWTSLCSLMSFSFFIMSHLFTFSSFCFSLLLNVYAVFSPDLSLWSHSFPQRFHSPLIPISFTIMFPEEWLAFWKELFTFSQDNHVLFPSLSVRLSARPSCRGNKDIAHILQRVVLACTSFQRSVCGREGSEGSKSP